MISNPKTKRIIPQEMIVIETFPEKVCFIRLIEYLMIIF